MVRHGSGRAILRIPGDRMKHDWTKLERDVVERIRALEAFDEAEMPEELRAKLWNDVVMPNLRLLAEFCVNVRVDE